MKRLRALRGSPEARSATSLYVLHLGGYVLPLVSFPYLIVTLGPSAFGIYGFVLAAARYGIVITDWSFNLTATRDAAVARQRGEGVDVLYASVTAGRVALLGLCAVLAWVLSTSVTEFAQVSSLLWIALVGVAGSTLLPVWLFQAYHRLPVVAGITLALRTVGTLLLFVLVDSSSDLWIVLWLWALPWLVSGVIAMGLVRRALGVSLRMVSWRAVLARLREGGHVFISSAAVTLYTAGNVLMLGLLTDSSTDVGIYVAAETVIVAAVGLLGPLGQALFPRSAQAGARGKEAITATARQLLRPFVFVGLGLALACVVAAPVLGVLFFGNGFEASVHLIQVMAVIPLAVAVATVFGQQTLIPLRMDARYARVVVGGGILNVVLALALVPMLGAWGSAIAVTTTEVMIAVGLWAALRASGVRLGWR